MTVDELIERLQEQSDAGYGEHEIQLATQSNYPLRYNLRGVAGPDELVDAAPDPDADPDGEEDASDLYDQKIVWLVEGSQHYDDPYGVPRACWDVV